MKYKKLTLTPQTLGLCLDRLNKITQKGFFSVEGAWSKTKRNPLSKDIKFGDLPRTCFYKEIKSTICVGGIFINSPHSSNFGTEINWGDEIYLSQNEILVKPIKQDFVLNKFCLRKIKLLPNTKETQSKFFKYQRIKQEEDKYSEEYFKDYERTFINDMVEDFI